MIKFYLRKKCKLCKKKYRKNVAFAEIRLETLDGFHNIECCPACAHVIDKSADVLLKGKKPDENDDEPL